MPEGDTIYRAASTLREVLADREVVRSDMRVPRFALCTFNGMTVTDVYSVGKHLFLRFSDGPHIHAHFAMDGSWRVYPRGGRWDRPGYTARAIVGTAEHDTVGFELAICEVLSADEAAASVAHLGPDLLNPHFDAEEAVRRLSAHPDTPIGLTALDQRNVAGIGNVYRNELCFVLGILPTTLTADVNVQRFVELSRHMLLANKNRSQRNTTGNARAAANLWVYGRERKPCYRCRTPIRRAMMGDPAHVARGDRVIYWCPRCQV